MMTERVRKVIFAVLAGVLLGIFAFFAAFFVRWLDVGARIPLVIDCFDVSGADLESRGQTENGSRGIIVTPEREGAYVQTHHETVGEFKTEFEASFTGNGEMALTFETKDGEQFALVVAKTDDGYAARVEIGGKKAGLYYVGSNNATGLTNVYNSAGHYTEFGSTRVFSLRFDNQTGELLMNNRLVWNIYSDMLDGREMPTVAPLEQYTVRYVFREFTEGSNICLMSVNEQAFPDVNLVDTQAAGIYASFDYQAQAGADYAVPAPVASDFVEGDLSDSVKVSVTKDEQVVLSERDYEAGFTFLPGEAGTYKITYTVADAAGNRAEKTYSVRAVANQQTTYTWEGSFADAALGTNATVEIPAVTLESDLLFGDAGKTAQYTVYFGEEVYDGLEKVLADQPRSVTFAKAGEYRVVFCDGDNAAVTTRTVTFTVSDEIIAYDPVDLGEQALGSRLTIPARKAYLNGSNYDMTAVVYAPDGGCYSNAAITLNWEGRYVVEYTATIENVVYTQEAEFFAAPKTDELFSANFATAEYKKSSYNNSLYGIEVESSGNGVVTYNEIIDVSDLTKDDLLIDILVTTTTPGTAEFTTLLVTLTDVEDPENELVFRARDADTDSYQKTYIQGRASGQQFTGYSYQNGKIETADRSGTVMEHSFSACNSNWYYPVQNNSLKFFYDNQELALYVINQSDNVSKCQVIEFDNPEHFSNVWGGFTSGCVKLSISVEGVTTRAHYLIKSIYGNDFNKSYQVDAEAPEITVATPATVPNAKVGVPYRVFDTQVNDASGLAEESVKVYYDMNHKIEVPVIDGAFTPFIEGEYTIEYTVQDVYGMTASKSVVVTAEKEPEKIGIELDESGETTGQVGKSVRIHGYELTATGVGESVNIVVKNGEKAYELSDGTFLPTESGTYKVTYTVADYVGQETSVSYDVVVAEYDDIPVLQNDIVLPRAMLSGYRCELPEAHAVWYNNGEEKIVTAEVSVTINGQAVEVTNGIVVPNVTEDTVATVTYTFKEGDGLSIPMEIPVKVVREGNAVYPDRFFSKTGFGDAKRTLYAIEFPATEEVNTLSFIRPVAANPFSFEFSFNDAEGKQNAGGVRITLSDAKDPSVAVVLDIDRNSQVSVNGATSRVPMSGSVNDETFMINYNNNSCTLTDGQMSLLGVVTHTAQGAPFSGFPSGQIYVDVSLYAAEDQSAAGAVVAVKSLNYQVLNRYNSDMIAPMIVKPGGLGGRAEVGEHIIVYPAAAYDVLSDIAEFTVTVTNTTANTIVKDVNGQPLENVDATKQYEFVVDSAADFSISYYAKDSSGAEVTEESFIYVPDHNPPTIEVNGKVPTEAELGKTVSLPKATATDAEGVVTEVFAMVTLPSGRTVVATDGFVAEQEGTYTIRYFAYDDSYNVASVAYTLQV